MFDGGAGAVIGAFTTLGLLMAIVAVITGRHLADERAMRPRAIYLSVAMLPVLVIGVVAASAFIEAAVQLVLGPEQEAGFLGGLGGGMPGAEMGGMGELVAGIGDFGLDPTDAAIRTLVAAGITAIVALAVYRLHLDWRRHLTGDGLFLRSPAARTFQAFAYTVVLVFVVIFVASAIEAGYGVFRVAAPGTSAMFPIGETAERERGIADIVSGLALAGASWWLVQTHWKLAGTWRGDADDTTSVPEPPAV
jgi:nitrate reductase NapE component